VTLAASAQRSRVMKVISLPELFTGAGVSLSAIACGASSCS
jgi:hypothetical protein